MEWKWLWVVLVAFLLGGWCECEGCWDQEKTALLQLKPFFTHIDDVKNYWVEGKQSSDCCEWGRVECDNSTGRVIQLFLNLTTTMALGDIVYTVTKSSYGVYESSTITKTHNWYLNASLFLPFEELKSLYLSGNSIAGCVDSQGFERLSLKLNKLEILDLSENNFNNSLLASLSELSSLKSLYLGGNQFTASNLIEGIERLSKLNKLGILDLRGNILGNNILSHLQNFTSLKSLRLQRCGLKGTIDMLEFNNLMNLKELYLGENEIESLGSLFQSEGQLRLIKLEVLGLSYNQFNNSIFSSLTALSNLKCLYISENNLKGAIRIQAGIERLSKLNKLEILDLQGNILGNNILSHLQNFTSLKSLHLQSCGLKGTIDMLEFNNLMNLKELYLDDNEIESLESLFESEGQLRLTKLEVLGLSYNQFNNSIFSSLTALSNLKRLYISENNLKGAIRIQELNALSNLVELDMSFNELTDFVPSQDSENELRLMNLEVLDLRSNLFNSSILSSLGRLSNLKFLSLGGEKLEGSIDLGGLYALSNLEELYLSCYYFKACSFPLQSFDSFPLLRILSLYGFSFHGILITQRQRLMNLEVLHLSGNFKNSSILSSLGRLSNLKYLYLSCPYVEGSIDLRACSLPLQSLDLSPSLKTLFLDGFSVYGTWTTQSVLHLENLESLSIEEISLENNFLQKLGAMPSLKFLELRSCKLNGTLHFQGLHLENLESLSIEEISLENNFLQKLGAMPSLKFLELWSCKLNGTLHFQGLHLENLESLSIEEISLENNFLQKLGAMPSLKFLELWSCKLNGTLHFQGLHLENLESLVIGETSLENNFLQKIGAMPSLRSLELWDCGLNGTLHTQGFCELTNLQELEISNNNLKGNLPECFSNLTSLESLYLSSNQLFGNISVLKSLVSLERLDLSNNNFKIPSSLGPLFNLSKLQHVDADNNTIYAETQMHSLAPTFQLNSISLSCCGNVGSFPQFLYHQHNLKYVDLSNIKLIGEFPNWLLENNSNLYTLVIANNSLLGHFELPFLSHTTLSKLDISKNSFHGNIPNEIGAKLPSLWSLNMSRNYFDGSIPISMGNMNSLEILDLSNNKLTGGVPEHLAIGCSALSVLSLSNNKLQGQIFSSNFNLTNLSELQLDGNNFSGRIPDCLSDCSFLSTLDLSNNQIFGDIPRWMENISRLSTLDLSNNKLFGAIPRWMGNMSNLEEIVMANNHLEGPIPMEFCQLNLKLKLLDLSMNNISGSIPSCFSPLWISQVHLSRNKLQGPLTNAFRNSTILVTLDLSNNHLTGNIPNWIGKLSQLSHLLLNNNHFEGVIPAQLCKLGHLSLIDLSQNNLSGTIPPCLKITTLNDISQDYVRYVAAVAQAPSSFSTEEPIEFTTKNISYSYKGRVLTYLSGIDLSCNKLTGEIPHEVKNFQKIIVLNLSHNSLTGTIPPAISDLRQIESLDLSYNKLSGKIPSQLVGLNYLSYFSVAYNNLSGSTPDRTAQFATFEENSYLGNPLLCGAPLPKNCSTEGPSSSIPKASTEKGSIDMNVFYVSFVVSYIMAVLGIASVLYINPYWRQAWFYHLEASITSCYYFVIDNLLPKRFR